MNEQRTVEQEANVRAKAAGLPCTPEFLAMVEAQLRQWAPYRVEYADLRNPSLLLDVREYPEMGLTHVRFNLDHVWVANVMLHRGTTPEQRAAIEVVMMVTMGVGEHDLDEAARLFYVQHRSTIGRYLSSAGHVMFDFDRRTGMNLLMESDDEYDLDDWAAEVAP